MLEKDTKSGIAHFRSQRSFVLLLLLSKTTLHYRLRGSIGKRKFFLNWLAFAHFWSNFDEIFCAGVKPRIFFKKIFFCKYYTKICHFFNNMWRGRIWNLKFCMKTKRMTPKKMSQNSFFFHFRPLHGENAIWKIFFYFFQFLLKKFKQKFMN